ncbi:MAG TPA: carboxypeptidase-like regulatory domain-containing protein [Dehalococcoidia bacterium]
MTRVSDGSTIYFARTGAFGPSGNTTLKGTGWRIVNVNLDAYVGQQVRLEFAAGGTSDSLYGSWAYIDSASSQQASTIVDTPATQVDGEPPMLDPTTGQIIIPQSPGDTSLTISTPIQCPDGTDPLSVTAILSKAPESVPSAPTIQISLTKAPDPSTVWTGTFPIPAGQSDATVWDLNFTVVCENDGTINVPVGKVILIDPSGFITDAVTDLPIQGATVTLQRFDAGAWHDVNPFELVSGSPTIAPQVNPLLTNEVGHYAWDVAAGKYRVVVSADGYVSQTSSEVDIPPPVFDLNLALQPIGSLTWGDVNCSGGGPDPIDSLLILRDDAGLSSASAQGACPALSVQLVVNGVSRFWGDLDCSGGPPNPVDSLKTLRHDAGLSVSKADPSCPNAGSPVTVG